MTELKTSTDLVINYFIQICSSKETLIACFFINFSPHVICFVIRALQFSTSFLFFTCFTVTSKNYGRRESLSLSKISFSLLSGTTECVFANNSHKTLSYIRTLLCKATIANKGSYKGKKRGILNQWSLCCSLMVLKIGCPMWSVCNLRSTHPASSCQ